MKERKRATVTASKGSKDRKADKEKEEMQNDKKKDSWRFYPFQLCDRDEEREKIDGEKYVRRDKGTQSEMKNILG